jgi:hypothetical protein
VNQEQFFVAVLKALDACGIPHMVTGSVGAMLHGEPRLTNDIDIVAEMLPRHVEPLLDCFASDAYYVPSAEAVRRAVAGRGMFNIIHVESGSKADIIVRRDDELARSEFARRRRVPFTEEMEAFAASPEDLVLSKLLFYERGHSETHLRDIAGMLRISGTAFDQEYLRQWILRLGLEHAWQAAQDLAARNE